MWVYEVHYTVRLLGTFVPLSLRLLEHVLSVV